MNCHLRWYSQFDYGGIRGYLPNCACKLLEPLQVLEQCGDAAYEKRAKRTLEQVKALRTAAHDRSGVDNHSDAMPLPPILRASLFGSWICEYYTYGHDVVTSALESGYLNEEGVPACPAIELSKLPDEHLSNLSFLFGGVGDARHVYTTLCDVGKQWNELSDAKKAKFRLNMLLNDINPTALTRDVLMIAALVHLGQSASTHEDCEDDDTEAFHLATAVQYMFSSVTPTQNLFTKQSWLLLILLSRKILLH